MKSVSKMENRGRKADLGGGWEFEVSGTRHMG